jgi:hypothetical protein
VGLHREDYDQLRRTAESFLEQFPSTYHEDILLGAATSLYLRGEGGSDAALWLAGEETDSFKPGIGNKMVSALRRVGVLQALDESSTLEASAYATYQVWGIRDVWRGLSQEPGADGHAHSRRAQLEAKQRVRELAGTSFRQMLVTLHREGAGFAAYAQGERLGWVEGRKGQIFTEGQRFRIQHALAENGSLYVAALPQIQTKQDDQQD